MDHDDSRLVSGSRRTLESMITLWGRRNSMNVQKVVWALEELGLAYERHNAAGSYGGTNTASFKAMNPMGLVPVLRDGDISMFESNAIVRYLAARYGEGNFRPREPGALARAEQWMDWAQLNVGPPTVALFFQSVRTAPESRNKEVSQQATQAPPFWQAIRRVLATFRSA
jgi:glutathione S-transferase